ncbi:hypothetical protein [Paenibacillus harenae]|uniref:hypothetical protein n=1 Tax=Paenibacillus harenae TaxID=306543 RepID=UPI0027927CCA|nr:hypothetical protein [Paenibacillus harenae]MDQ0058861.1 hypothetical protein [Paenibacillus harenae]
MSLPLTVQAAKASLISSLAKSQHALARILDSIANVADQSPETARLLRDNVHMLTNMQRSMAEAVLRTDLNNRGKGHNNKKNQPAKSGTSAGTGTNNSGKLGKSGKLWSPDRSSRSGAKSGSSSRKAGRRHAKK